MTSLEESTRNGEQVPGAERKETCSCLKTLSNATVSTLEEAFYRLGILIGKYPWVFMLGCGLLVAAFLPGIIFFFEEENREEKLWIASGAQSLRDQEKVNDWFPSRVRFQNMIVVNENVLTPDTLNAMLDIDLEVKAINKSGRYNWTSLCARLGPLCWSNSLLELWSFDESTIRGLSQQDILDMVNSVTTSPVYGTPYNIELVLGQISYDAGGDIVAAEATSMNWVLNFNVTISGGQETDELAEDWELSFIDIAEKGHADIEELYYFAFRSSTDVAASTIMGDVTLFAIGFIIIIIFVMLVLGQFNAVHHRIYMSLGGVFCIGMAIALSFGLCSYAGLFFGPVHTVLPFLLLGIGVDDMFVICQAWDNLGPDTDDLPIHEKIGRSVRHAGVSITITSLTDIMAFGIGATTVLPALESFCIYACVGILATFIFQLTFFVACLTYDQRRVQDSRDACCCCIVRQNYEPNECSKRELSRTFCRDYYGKTLVKLPTKVAVVCAAAGLLAWGIYGTATIEQQFDPTWFLPSGTYAADYVEASKTYFPGNDITTAVYIGDVDYFGDFSVLEKLYADVVSDEYTIADSVDCWYMNYRAWLRDATDPAVTDKLDSNAFPIDSTAFYELVQLYITPPNEGAAYIKDLLFPEQPTELKILASRMSLSHINLEGSTQEIDAMESLRRVASSTGYPESECFAYSRFYFTYETNKVIQNELFRNLGLAFLCVFLMTLILIAHPWTCTLVCSCVVLTLLEVIGLMRFWGLTIDTVTSINLIVAIGLAVDYAAHIGYHFMTELGTRNERTVKTLGNIAPAVAYGGFSTFLAFVLLAGSNSYVFTTFFRVFLGVVFFGLFQGIVLLPVLLSWLGPAPYLAAENEARENTERLNRKSSLQDYTVENGSVPLDEVHANGELGKPAINGYVSGSDNPTFSPDELKSPVENAFDAPRAELRYSTYSTTSTYL